MKTWLKLLIAAIVGLVVMWLCYQIFHLDSIMTTVASMVVTLAAYTVCDKAKKKGE